VRQVGQLPRIIGSQCFLRTLQSRSIVRCRLNIVYDSMDFSEKLHVEYLARGILTDKVNFQSVNN